jgi:integrase
VAKKRANGEGSITRRNDGLWQGSISLGYNDKGKRKRETRYGRTQAEVRQKLDELKWQLAGGTFSDTKLLVKDYLAQWLAEKEREVKPRTADFYHYYIRMYINPHLGWVRLDKLTPLQVQAMMGALADASGVSTANKSRGVLFSALKQAVRWQLIPRNPVEAVNKLKEQKRDMTIWTTEEALQFLSVATKHRLYAAFYLSMSTGLRCGELLGLHWADLHGNSLRVTNNLVNLWGREGQKGRLIIQSPKTNKAVRRVVISPAVTGVLEQHRERQEAERAFLGEAWQEHGLVFASEVGTPLHPRNFARVWYGLQEKADVTRVRLHDLRDLHVSLLVKEGFDPQTIADRIGHTDPAFTLRQYSHAFEEQRQAAGVDIMDLLSSTAGTKKSR